MLLAKVILAFVAILSEKNLVTINGLNPLRVQDGAPGQALAVLDRCKGFAALRVTNTKKDNMLSDIRL
jgi:hypothetical protein